MNRQHPFLSPVGCGAALVFLLGVAIVAGVTGGELFNPGDVSAVARADSPTRGGFAAHAAFESDCRQCHAPFAGIDSARCEQCHTTVTDERLSATGPHGAPSVGDTQRCEACHREHRGRAADLLVDARARFDHATLPFILSAHRLDYLRDNAQQPLAQNCAACHVDHPWRTDLAACTACHTAHDQPFMLDHTTAFSVNCLDCHDGVDKMHAFDHAQEEFTLVGQHALAACSACHSAATSAAQTPTACVACHAEPAAHATLLGTACADCHTPIGWKPATLKNTIFDHAAATGFALTAHQKNFDSTALTCRACHTHLGQAFDEAPCTTCHSTADAVFMDAHVAQFGPQCLSCHDGTGNMKNFDHAQLFSLEGQHATLECAACHVDKKFKGTANTCVGCHTEPVVHAGLFGTNCVACHTTTAWAPAQLTQHAFPLNHGEDGEIPCATCHTATYTAYTCYGCHEHTVADITAKHAEENIRGERLNACTACHATGQKEEGGDD